MSYDGDAAETGRIFSIQRFSIHDGPGIRTTAFFKGCPLVCSWCHNPEGRDTEEEVWFVPGLCVHCGACSDACPEAGEGEDPPGPGGDLCLRCGACADTCPSGARQRVGRTMTARELMEQVRRDRAFYEQTGGGVTFSGGEPLMQAEFLLRCLHLGREAGLHAAVDTSGWCPRSVLLEVSRLTDLFLFDLKTADPSTHLKRTGVELEPILENLRSLDEWGAEVWLRIPVIPGLNDGEEAINGLAHLAGSLRRTKRVHLLPYHETGTDKNARLGREVSGAIPVGPSTEALDAAAARLATYGLEVHVGG